MLKVASDNKGLSQITSLQFARLGLNRDENLAILETHPEHELIAANERYQLRVDHIEEIDQSIQPTVKKYLKGPFTMAVYNVAYPGQGIDRSFLVFEIKPHEETPHKVIDVDPQTFTSRSIAALPFVDVFKAEIDKEVKRSMRFVQTSKVKNIYDKRFESDLGLLEVLQHKLNALHSEDRADKSEVMVGISAIMHTLSASLNARSDFYQEYWRSATAFYEESFRYLGEQYALGNTSLEGPKPILPN